MEPVETYPRALGISDTSQIQVTRPESLHGSSSKSCCRESRKRSHHLDCRKEPWPRKPMRHDALYIDVLILS